MSSEFLRQLQSVPAGEDREWLVLQLGLSALSPELRDAVRACAIPHWFDPEFLAALLGRPVEEARTLLEDLTSLSFVEPFIGRGHSLHASTRVLLLSRMWQDDQYRFRDLSGRAADYCAAQDQSQFPWRIEWVYHLLVASPDEGGQQLKSVARAWRQLGAYDRVESLLRAAREQADAGRLTAFETALTKLWEANVHWDYSHFPLARDAYEEAWRLFRELGQQVYESRSLAGAAAADLAIDEYEAARERFADALRVSQKIEDKRGEGQCLHGLGDTYRAVGDFEMARRHYHEARQIFHEVGNIESDEAYALWGLGEVHEALGEFEAAEEKYEEARRLFETAGASFGEILMVHKRGVLYCALGAYDKARKCCDEAIARLHQIGSRQAEALCLEGLGKVQHEIGEFAAAEQCYGTARAIYEAVRDRRGIASSLRGLGDARRRLHYPEVAREHYERARKICSDIRDALGEADSVLCLADLDQDTGRWSAAKSGYLHALEQYRAAGTKPRIAMALRSLGKLWAHLGHADAARSHLAEALGLFMAMRLPQAGDAKDELAGVASEVEGGD